MQTTPASAHIARPRSAFRRPEHIGLVSPMHDTYMQAMIRDDATTTTTFPGFRGVSGARI